MCYWQFYRHSNPAMKKENKEFIIDLIKLLKPKHYDKVTWALIVVGLILVSRPNFLQIFNEYLKRKYQFEIIGKYDVLFGFILIIIALIYNTLIKSKELKSSRQIPETINAPITNNGNNIQDNHGIVIQNNYNFNISGSNPEDIQNIISSIQKANSAVSFKSVTKKPIDTRFINLFSELPWVDKLCIEPYNIHLNNETIIATNTLYSLSYRLDKKKSNKILIQSYESETEQFKFNHIKSCDNDFLIAIFWSEFNVWTVNSVLNFSKESQSIDFITAIKNDLSNLFGDFTFILTKTFIKIVYNSNNNSTSSARHAEFGAIEKAVILNNENEEIEITTLELSIIDAIFKTKVISQTNENGLYTVFERNSHSSIVKLTTLVQIILGQYKRELTPIDVKYAITIINNLLIKTLKATISQPIPTNKNEQTDYLFKLTFNGTKIIDSYSNKNSR